MRNPRLDCAFNEKRATGLTKAFIELSKKIIPKANKIVVITGFSLRMRRSSRAGCRRPGPKLPRIITPGDVVTVTRIDRLARSTFDLFAIVKRIVDAGGQFHSLAEPWADTATSTGRLMIAILGGLADVERDLIRTRTAKGRSRAKARGKHMGRTPSLTPQQQAEARQRRAEGATLKDLAQSYNVSMATISRLRMSAGLAPTPPTRAFIVPSIATFRYVIFMQCFLYRHVFAKPPQCHAFKVRSVQGLISQ